MKRPSSARGSHIGKWIGGGGEAVGRGEQSSGEHRARGTTVESPPAAALLPRPDAHGALARIAHHETPCEARGKSHGVLIVILG